MVVEGDPDLVLLGERGQAKTRMIRSLTGLLDEWMPIVAGSEINDDPFDPVLPFAAKLFAPPAPISATAARAASGRSFLLMFHSFVW